MSYSYHAYGLEMESSRPIEALNFVPSKAQRFDLSIQDGPEPDWVRAILSLPGKILKHKLEPAGAAEPSFILTQHGEAAGYELAYSDGTRFVTDDSATRLWGAYQPPMAAEEMAVYLLGPVMGFLLRRRHITCLHSSCVEFQGHAICLCGEAGFGKSTTAAALALRGLPVVAEDIVPLEETDQRFEAVPGYPRVCLWPESVELLLGSTEALPLITSGWEKRYLALDGQRAKFAEQKLPLILVYVFAPRVNEDSAPRIEVLGAREAMLELVGNTYLNWVLDPRQRAEEFDTLCRLVKQVSVRRIVPHAQPEKIGGLCDLILQDAETYLSSHRDSPNPVRR